MYFRVASFASATSASLPTAVALVYYPSASSCCMAPLLTSHQQNANRAPFRGVAPDDRAYLSCRSSPALTTTAHEVPRMTLHYGHRRHDAPLKEQEIPASHCSSSSGLTLGAGYLSLFASCPHSKSSDLLSKRTRRHIQILPEVLPAPIQTT